MCAAWGDCSCKPPAVAAHIQVGREALARQGRSNVSDEEAEWFGRTQVPGGRQALIDQNIDAANLDADELAARMSQPIPFEPIDPGELEQRNQRRIEHFQKGRGEARQQALSAEEMFIAEEGRMGELRDAAHAGDLRELERRGQPTPEERMVMLAADEMERATQAQGGMSLGQIEAQTQRRMATIEGTGGPEGMQERMREASVYVDSIVRTATGDEVLHGPAMRDAINGLEQITIPWLEHIARQDPDMAAEQARILMTELARRDPSIRELLRTGWGHMGRGALGGAIVGGGTGAAIGAPFGGVGALPGAKIGALVGAGVGSVGGVVTMLQGLRTSGREAREIGSRLEEKLQRIVDIAGGAQASQ